MGKGKNSYFDALKDPIQLVGKSRIALTKKEVFVNKKLYLEDFFRKIVFSRSLHKKA